MVESSTWRTTAIGNALTFDGPVGELLLAGRIDVSEMVFNERITWEDNLFQPGVDEAALSPSMRKSRGSIWISTWSRTTPWGEITSRTWWPVARWRSWRHQAARTRGSHPV